MAEILMVDDCLESRQMVRAFIAESHFHYATVKEAETAEKGRFLLKQNEPSLMLIDISLPDEDGIVFGKKAIELYPHLPVIVLTYIKMFQTIQTCMNAGFSSYLLKPISKDELLANFDRLLAKRMLHNTVPTADGSEPANQSFKVNIANPMETAINYIQLNVHEPLTLKDIANLVYLSPSHFSRMFKEETGINFVEYLTRQRVEKSKSLLRLTSIPMDVVANKSGFSSSGYFSTTFKRIEGITPSEYRNLFSSFQKL